MNTSTKVLITIGVVVAIAVAMAGLPMYNVWSQEMKGRATLAKASQERQVLVEKAKAEKEAAKEEAEAIKILGEAASNYPQYRLQKLMAAYAEALEAGTIEQIIYVPTEAGLPIMEASRFTND